MNEKNPRRIFLKQSALYAFSISAFGLLGCKPGDENPAELPDMTTCQTTEDILGPYYRPNAPIRTNLVLTGHTSTELFVTGHVYMDDCTSPLPGALVEFWQSDGEGEYDNDSTDYRYRGSQQVGEDGAYSFKTILPGRYPVGSSFRPSHIHFKITAPVCKELVSQIYFKDDPFISSDSLASRPAAKQRILEITKDDNGLETVHFPIYMAKR